MYLFVSGISGIVTFGLLASPNTGVIEDLQKCQRLFRDMLSSTKEV